MQEILLVQQESRVQHFMANASCSHGVVHGTLRNLTWLSQKLRLKLDMTTALQWESSNPVTLIQHLLFKPHVPVVGISGLYLGAW